MPALVVFAHPESSSLTGQVARAVADGISTVVDLAAEGFDPRYSTVDLEHFRAGTGAPGDVLSEQARLEGVTDLVLAYPVYWWSMPALLKGWLDRVLTSGWAYGEDPETGRLIKKMTHLRVHLLALAETSDDVYDRRAYEHAMLTQIDRGIFDYVGAEVVTSLRVNVAVPGAAEDLLARAAALGRELAGGELVR